MPKKKHHYTKQKNKYAISIKRIRQSKHQLCHLNKNNTPNKTSSTPISIKIICQIRRPNQKTTPTKTRNTPSHAKEYANVNFSPQYWFTLFCREAIIDANLRTFRHTIWSSENCAGVQKMTNYRYVNLHSIRKKKN